MDAPARHEAGGTPRSARGAEPRRRRPLATAALKPAVFAACCLPLAKLAADAARGALGANPVEAGLDRLGFWTLAFVALALVPTPLHDLLGWRWPQRVRRMLGLFAFAYATLHVLWYVGVDRFFDLREVAADVTKRRFQAAGMLAWLLLVPLALTSTDRAVRRLGYARWKRLHRATYAVAVLGVVHFWWRVKADVRSPALFAAAFGALFAARGWARYRASANRSTVSSSRSSSNGFGR